MTTAKIWRFQSKAMVACLLPSLLLSSCQQFGLHDMGGCADDDLCRNKAGVCAKPTIRALAQDLDTLEDHIEKFGSVVTKQPDVWGQARLTQHRQEFEQVMAVEKDNFLDTLQGSLNRSDQAYFADAVALSAAVSSSTAGAAPPNRVLVTNTNAPNTVAATPLTPLALPDQSSTFASFSGTNITRNAVGTGPSLGFATSGKGGIQLEPIVHLDQKAAFLNHLQELRRINEGDDTSDSPGYSLNLVRIPVSVLPGKCTEIGHGAEVTMTLTPYLNDELLPTTFRNLLLNDLVDQIGFPVTQFINNPENSCYLSEGAAADLDEFLTYVDTHTPIQMMANPSALARSRWKLSLQPLFARPEWAWVDQLLNTLKEDPTVTETAKVIAAVQSEPVQSSRPMTDQEKAALEKERQKAKDLFEKMTADPKSKVQVDETSRLGDRFVTFTRVSPMRAGLPVAGTKSRRARMPFPPGQLLEVYGDDFAFQLAAGAYRALAKEQFIHPCPDSGAVYIHLPDIQGYLQEEQAAAEKLLSQPCNVDLWQFCTPDLVSAVRNHNVDQIRVMREGFRTLLSSKAGADKGGHSVGAALAWATVVEAALLTDQLVQDMREAASSKGCACSHSGWLDYYLPNPSPEARQAFNEYVRCRWPIHVFALDPVTQQQNLADTFSGRREMQFAMSLAFVTGQINARNMMNYARRIEYDFATIDINGTSIGFSHGDETFGWRFYPRFQTPDIDSNATVFFRDLLIGGPNRNAFLNERRLEPEMRECVAIVMMPSFVPYADLNVSSNWFKLTNPKNKVLDTTEAMKLSKAVKSIQNCAGNVSDADCYRDGDLERLLKKAQQLEVRLPLQSTKVQVPYENTLGGFAMFNTGVTDLSPELTGFYGTPSINLKSPTTVFLVGNHFSIKQTYVVAGGQDVSSSVQLLSRQVLKAVIPANAITVTDPNTQQQFVDVHLATPYGVTQHLLIPVCSAAAGDAATTANITVGFVYSGLGIAAPATPNYKPSAVALQLPAPIPSNATTVDVVLKFAKPNDDVSISLPGLKVDATKGTCQLPGDLLSSQVIAGFATKFGPEATNPPVQVATSGGTLTFNAAATALPGLQTPPAITINWVKAACAQCATPSK